MLGNRSSQRAHRQRGRGLPVRLPSGILRTEMPEGSPAPKAKPSLEERVRVLCDTVEMWLGRSAAWLRAWLGGAATLRAVAVAIVPLALSPWLIAEARKELASPLFRDAVQCQYSAWCVLHGLKLYRDVGAPDGPLIHFLHALLQLFAGGHGDAAFRKADLWCHVLGSGAMGVAFAPRVAETRLGNLLVRGAWAALAASLWLGWYFSHGWANTVQRDSFFALFGYLGLVLVYTSADHTPKVARYTAGVGGWLCALLLFSRHSGLIYPVCAVFGLFLADDPLREMRTARIKAAALGAALGVGTIFLLLLAFGSVSGLWFWYFRYPFTFHAWLAKLSATYLFTEFYLHAGQAAFVVLVGVVAGVAVRLVPRRAMIFAFPPLLFLIAACVVGKGWPNHVQQTTIGAIVLALLVLSELWKRGALEPRWAPVHAGAAALALLFVGHDSLKTIHASTYLTQPMPAPIDGDIVDAKRVGDFLKRHTKPADRIFLYGHEAHVLLNAERGPAVPSYVNHSLNIQVFYERAPAAPGQGPNRRQWQAILKLQHDISADACARLKAAPPAAMVFLDNSLGLFLDARAEVKVICPEVEPMLATRYREVTVPDVTDYHVYLRR